MAAPDPSIRGGRPLGWEFAERYPHIYRDPPVFLQHRPACPVCGHPTGACTEEDHQIMVAKAQPAQDPRPTDDQNFVRNAHQAGALTAAEANRRAADQHVGPALVTVKEDVYEEVTDANATTKRTRLKYVRGQVITEAEAKASGVRYQQESATNTQETK